MSDILISTEGAVTTITFNRLAKKNSLVPATYSALTEALREAASNDEVRVVVVQGDEAIFSAGNDLGDFANTPPTDADTPVWGFLEAIVNFPKPLIAAVCGPAVGVGTTMLLHCDLVYLGENAKLMMPFTDLGVCPEAGSSLLVPQLLGYRRAAEIFYFAEPILPEEAVRVGLANKVLPVAEVNAYAQEQAAKLAARPRTAILETKRLLKQGYNLGVKQQMQEESAAFTELLQGPAAKEAFAAFFAGRAPDFASVGE